MLSSLGLVSKKVGEKNNECTKAGIIKEQGGSKCEDRGRISVEELTAQNRSKWGKHGYGGGEQVKPSELKYITLERGSLEVMQSGEVRKAVSLKWPFGRKIPEDLVFCLPLIVWVIQLLVAGAGFPNIFSLRTNIAEVVLFCLLRPEVLGIQESSAVRQGTGELGEDRSEAGSCPEINRAAGEKDEAPGTGAVGSLGGRAPSRLSCEKEHIVKAGEG